MSVPDRNAGDASAVDFFRLCASFVCVHRAHINTDASVESVSGDTTLEGCNCITGNQPIDPDALDLDHSTCPCLLNLALIFPSPPLPSPPTPARRSKYSSAVIFDWYAPRIYSFPPPLARSSPQAARSCVKRAFPPSPPSSRPFPRRINILLRTDVGATLPQSLEGRRTNLPWILSRRQEEDEVDRGVIAHRARESRGGFSGTSWRALSAANATELLGSCELSRIEFLMRSMPRASIPASLLTPRSLPGEGIFLWASPACRTDNKRTTN